MSVRVYVGKGICYKNLPNQICGSSYCGDLLMNNGATKRSCHICQITSEVCIDWTEQMPEELMDLKLLSDCVTMKVSCSPLCGFCGLANTFLSVLLSDILQYYLSCSLEQTNPFQQVCCTYYYICVLKQTV